MAVKTLHQFAESAIYGDAITDQALLIRKWLRAEGFRSEIYTEHCLPEMEREVLPVSSYNRQNRDEILIYHHAIGASVAERLLRLEIPIILIYHNITPPEFFSQANPALSKKLEEGREQLRQLRDRTLLALGDSDYNELELREYGYARTGVLPIVLDPVNYKVPADPAVLGLSKDGRKSLLFVGRIAPNKKQEDLIKLQYYYKRVEPEARLFLVGSTAQKSYVYWLRELASAYNLDDSVFITGHVTQAEMIAYYQVSDLYVSFSEHEGFGKPLIESMYFDLPVLAYSSSAIPHTLGGAGMLFKHKHYEALAEVADILISDESIRLTIKRRQRDRVQGFLEPQVQKRWRDYLDLLR